MSYNSSLHPLDGGQDISKVMAIGNGLLVMGRSGNCNNQIRGYINDIICINVNDSK